MPPSLKVRCIMNRGALIVHILKKISETQFTKVLFGEQKCNLTIFSP